jgi:hypothetical protein
MNLRTRFLALAGLLALLCLALLQVPTQADSVYSYTGNAYTTCEGSYSCTGTTPAMTITFDMTLTGSALDISI